MGKYYILYNPHSGSWESKTDAECLYVVDNINENLLIDMTSITSYEKFFDDIFDGDGVVICGGDGTLNRFVNETKHIKHDAEIYYYPSGSGNDFYRDVNGSPNPSIVRATDYLKGLPKVTVKGEEHLFINGVGYGIDGYCCQVGDEKKRQGKKKVNYTKIAISGLLFHYKPTNATVTVDGVEYKFKKVWIAPTMNGRYYGGGMMPTPHQKRNGKYLSVMVFHGSGKLKTLSIFPSIFKGKHTKHRDSVRILTGKKISVSFDEPRPLQIDGETIQDVLNYTAEIK